MNYVPHSAKNWYSAMGVLFIIMAMIVLVRNLIIFGPDFVLDFFLNSEITNEKVSLGMIVFGGFLIVIGFKKSRVASN